jgi:hypothetical protein
MPVKKLKTPRTVRPPPDLPVMAYRYGAAVLIRLPDPPAAVLTPTEARDLAALLIEQAALAETTDRIYGCCALPHD